jgi:hypothetical protein
MKVVMVAIVTLSFVLLLPRGIQISAATVGSPPLSVNAANAFCGTHPAGRERIWLHGWFTPSMEASGFVWRSATAHPPWNRTEPSRPGSCPAG